LKCVEDIATYQIHLVGLCIGEGTPLRVFLDLRAWPMAINPGRPKQWFLPQHDELFKFQESYKTEGTRKQVLSIS
jgi:hypothetical protein